MTRRLGAGAIAAALLMTALTTFATSTAAGAADPAFGAPAVGQCSAITAPEIQLPTYSGAPVDCAGEHTSQVIAVGQMPADLGYEDKGLARFALETCYPAQKQVLGTKLPGVRLTAYDLAYFAPTAEQQAAGARWLRCDLVLRSDDVLLPLPAKLDLGRKPYAKGVSRCLAGRDFHVTVCSDKHTFRATAALKVKGNAYRSKKAWTKLGTERCRAVTRSRTYRFSWPSKVSWKVGDRSLVCYTQTRR
ncbi:septum formation family protein [Nocardioides sp. J2M5]|uniref:septum formation family protein n=1 Tax=Nocardioides palaemonis TaxID=2829810 RepID=UPI001BAB5019|nr:septum formation family protein [Nocardioides palaemonis]MBS2936297.1 septum formation family protein [Nocardioides palaemonis]